MTSLATSSASHSCGSVGASLAAEQRGDAAAREDVARRRWPRAARAAPRPTSPSRRAWTIASTVLGQLVAFALGDGADELLEEERVAVGALDDALDDRVGRGLAERVA